MVKKTIILLVLQFFMAPLSRSRFKKKSGAAKKFAGSPDLVFLTAYRSLDKIFILKTLTSLSKFHITIILY